MRDGPSVVGIVLAVLLGGCSVRLYSPPSGTFPVESSAALGQGRSNVRGDIFWGTQSLGPDVSSYRLSVSHGVTDTIDVSLSPALTRIHGGREGDRNRNIGALRAGIKYAPYRYFAVIGGLGAGGSVGGSFLSPDLGLVVAYEDLPVIPFASARGFLSAPLRAKTVRFSTSDDADGWDEDAERDMYAIAPRLTWGWQLSGGLRVPLLSATAYEVIPALACALGFMRFYDRRHGKDGAANVGVSCAVDVSF